jgi:hypothetical protein
VFPEALCVPLPVLLFSPHYNCSIVLEDTPRA